MGDLAQQPQGAHLSHHAGGNQPPGSRGFELRANAERNQPRSLPRRVLDANWEPIMNWFKQFFARRQIYADFSAEIQQHLAEKVETLVASGMSRRDAEYAAKREFGNVARIEQSGRE